MPEIERAALTRLKGISAAPERPDSDYAEGLRSATQAALEYLLAGVEQGDADSLHPPPAVLVQARLAARNRVGLDTVLRRCVAGQALFGDFLLGELERLGDAEPELPKRLLREQAALLDRMFAAVSEEHAREAAHRSSATEKRRARLVERLLAGEPVDAAQLGYELEAYHLGIVAKGTDASEFVRELATAFDRHLLTVAREDDVLWAWLGGREPLDPADVLRRASNNRPVELRLALGESGQGTEAWRFSHRQATATLPIALCGPEPFIRYADVSLLTAILQDDLLATSLREIYLMPLESGRHRGEVLRETLRAYFAAGCNMSSAAASLDVRRHTVRDRLRAAEQLLGRALHTCGAELDIAIQVHDLFPHQMDGRISGSAHIGRPPLDQARSG